MGRPKRDHALTPEKCETILELVRTVGAAKASVLCGYGHSTCQAIDLADRRGAEGDLDGLRKIKNSRIEAWAIGKYGVQQEKITDKTDVIIRLLDSIDKSLSEIRKAVKGGLMGD